ncbi:MAG: hypothetical protein LBG95_05720 [Treponema sp.]|jgi:hypothetical protein|nr:hypothetical protein [Treponema sp.]
MKNNKKNRGNCDKLNILLIMAAFLSVLFLAACLSPWKGDEGTFSVSVGSAASGRAAGWSLDDAVIAMLTHTITLNGPSGLGQKAKVDRASQTVAFAVKPGEWEIVVEAALGAEQYARGSVKATIKPGRNGVITIPMGPPETSPVDITITLGKDELLDKLIVPTTGATIIKGGEKSSSLYITVDAQCDDVEWYIFGRPVTEYKGKDRITIHAENYNEGTYTLVVVAWIGGRPYSAEITFTVKEKI